MRRWPVLLLLILALVSGSVAPVSAGWRCPDGTACLRDGHGYRCAKSACALGEAHAGAADCCTDRRVRRCRHGDLPAMSGAVPVTAPGVLALADTGHCRFERSVPPDRLALRAAAATFHLLAPDGLPPRPPLLLARPVSGALRPPLAVAGHSPPFLRSAGPPRAPPLP